MGDMTAAKCSRCGATYVESTDTLDDVAFAERVQRTIFTSDPIEGQTWSAVLCSSETCRDGCDFAEPSEEIMAKVEMVARSDVAASEPATAEVTRS